MVPKAHSIKVEKTARYFSLGELNDKTGNIWIVCHGYAQLAEDFVWDFEALIDEETYVVAPEGLSRFYTKGFFGKIGATWMTSADRENEIKDYVNYLQRLYEQLKKQAPFTANFQLLGFSQGCATISRWAVMKQPDFDRLWICSGEISTDLDWEAFSRLSQKHRVNVICGTKDPFIPQNAINNLKDKLAGLKVNYKLEMFDGAHEINVEAIRRLGLR